MKFFKVTTLLLIFIPVVTLADCFKDTDNLFGQGKDFYFRQQYLLASQQFSLVSLMSCNKDQQNKGRLRWAQSLFELGETEEGNLILDKISSASEYWATSKVVKAWYQPTLIPSLSHVDSKRFQDFEDQTQSLSKVKKPWVAGTLSAIIPGAGQVYNGNYQAAAFSFVLNALFLSTAIELHKKNLDSTALAAGTIFSVVYVGNIASATQSSKAINDNYQAPQKEKIKLIMFPELTF